MATDRALRAELLKKLGGVTPQRLSQLVRELKRDHGPMSTEDGTYVLAHMKGLDLTKYLDRDTVDRIRAMVPRTNGRAAAKTPRNAAPAKRAARTSKPIRIAPSVPAVNLLLPPATANDAARMADLYPKMYLLENSIRNVINRVMSAKYGAGWWATHVATDVRTRVQTRKDKEAKAPWHGKRGTHDIYYSDFNDLSKIIVKNWGDFAAILPSQAWITQKLEELEPARNTLAHHNPVPENEQKRLDVYFDDWAALVDQQKSVIP